MDLSRKQANRMFLVNLFQTVLSVIAFIIVTYILLNIDSNNQKLIYLTLDIVIIGFIINGVFTFIKDHKSF